MTRFSYFWGCTNLCFFWQILYVDSLETTAVDLPDDEPRCTLWTNSLISLVADLDKDINGSFGALPVSTFVLDDTYGSIIHLVVILFFYFSEQQSSC
jgi:hypothetical protein